ncbi:MAG: molybdopterin cofactor-binding domain-containing protein [Ottowia sp.]
MIDYDKFHRTRNSRACAPKASCVGLGVVTYVEGTGIGPYEGAKVTVEASGRVSVATGIGTQGQGHYTSFAQDRGRPVGRAM